MRRSFGRSRRENGRVETHALPEGPHFVYSAAPDLFLGRTGQGPLRIAWDTNILIDYLTYGPSMWESKPFDVDDENRAELEALDLLIETWQVRDIRFTIFQRSITDARKMLAEDRLVARAKAVAEFASALMLVEWDNEDLDDIDTGREDQRLPFDLPPSAGEEVLDTIPEGADRRDARVSHP